MVTEVRSTYSTWAQLVTRWAHIHAPWNPFVLVLVLGIAHERHWDDPVKLINSISTHERRCQWLGSTLDRCACLGLAPGWIMQCFQGLGGRTTCGGGVDRGTHSHQRRPGCARCFLSGCESLLAATGRQSENKIVCVPVLQTTICTAWPLLLGRLLHTYCWPHKSTPLAAGKEVVVRYGSSLKTGRRFATDANGREMQVRWRQQRS